MEWILSAAVVVCALSLWDAFDRWAQEAERPWKPTVVAVLGLAIGAGEQWVSSSHDLAIEHAHQQIQNLTTAEQALQARAAWLESQLHEASLAVSDLKQRSSALQEQNADSESQLQGLQSVVGQLSTQLTHVTQYAQNVALQVRSANATLWRVQPRIVTGSVGDEVARWAQQYRPRVTFYSEPSVEDAATYVTSLHAALLAGDGYGAESWDRNFRAAQPIQRTVIVTSLSNEYVARVLAQTIAAVDPGVQIVTDPDNANQLIRIYIGARI